MRLSVRVLVALVPLLPLLATPAAAAPDAVLKVMPLGDSNTEGIDEAHVGYRADLWQLLTSDGTQVDFVGTLSHGAANLGDKDHEGHGGWTIPGLYDHVVPWLQTYHPDVVTLQIGTNDMNTAAGAAAAPGNLSALLDRITSTVPLARVFVTSIPDFRDPTATQRAHAYNAQLPGIVAANVAAGRRVWFVDIGPVYQQPGDFGDAVHPTYGASSKGASRWYGAITGWPTVRYEAESAAVAHARIDAATSASNGSKVGYLDYPDSAVTFTVNASSAGSYRLHLRGANGTGTPCTHLVSANGGAAQTVTYPSYGTDLPSWRLWSTPATTVQLHAGANAVRVTKGACTAELDALDVSGPTST